MKKISLILFSVLFCIYTFAQTPLDAFLQRADTCLLDIKFSYIVNSNFKVNGSGDAKIQGGNYILNTNGLQFYCNGTNLWTIDKEEKEVLIEKVSNNITSLSFNPTILLGRLKQYFNIVSESTAKFDNKTAKCISLNSKNIKDLHSLNLYFVANNLIGLIVKMNNGTTTKVNILSIAFSKKVPANYFIFNTDSLGKSWIITQ